MSVVSGLLFYLFAPRHTKAAYREFCNLRNMRKLIRSSPLEVRQVVGTSLSASLLVLNLPLPPEPEGPPTLAYVLGMRRVFMACTRDESLILHRQLRAEAEQYSMDPQKSLSLMGATLAMGWFNYSVTAAHSLNPKEVVEANALLDVVDEILTDIFGPFLHPEQPVRFTENF